MFIDLSSYFIFFLYFMWVHGQCRIVSIVHMCILSHCNNNNDIFLIEKGRFDNTSDPSENITEF